MAAMKGITIKLPADTLKALRDEARATGRTVTDVIRERIEAAAPDQSGSVHALTSDLAGSLAGSGRSATNLRRRFRKS
jgi:hypothetical protein